jgi:ABC-type branched-subunit amino acid transport system ATPase component
MSPSPLLAVEGLSVRYGGVRALDDLSLRVEAGEILGLIGPNGAGKTTLFECIAGFNPPSAGTVTFDGDDITRTTPEARARRGLIRSFQDARLFESLTVFQTVLVAQEKRHPTTLLADVASLPGRRRQERAKADAADELLATMGLTAFRDKLVAELSTGTRRITELACVVALEPRLLLLDEPSSGIAQREVEALGDLLGRIKEVTGTTMLVIEHDMPLIMGMADRIVALESGRPIAEGTPAEIQRHPQVIASYLGTTAETIHRSGAVLPGDPAARPSRPRRTRPLVAAGRPNKDPDA